jgi:hypothetical protein
MGRARPKVRGRWSLTVTAGLAAVAMAGCGSVSQSGAQAVAHTTHSVAVPTAAEASRCENIFQSAGSVSRQFQARRPLVLVQVTVTSGGVSCVYALTGSLGAPVLSLAAGTSVSEAVPAIGQAPNGAVATALALRQSVLVGPNDDAWLARAASRFSVAPGTAGGLGSGGGM